jgi:acetate kinase
VDVDVRVLVVNAGSSSMKLRVLDGDDALVGERDLAPDEPLDEALAALPPVDVVAHRVVHGGERFTEAVVVDDGVRAALEELTDLAPLHQPKSLRGLDAARAALPDVPHVACFDTAFHATLPAAAATYALPAAWRARWGIRRYGFHGLSHAYASRRAAELLDRPVADLRLVSCHLGAGASLCAVAGGVSRDTTMGFTPLEGLVMATRSGSVDPGLLLWLIEHEGVAPHELAETLEHESGLAALAGTPDMAAVLRRAADGDAAATLARDVYVHRLRAAIGAMAAALGGLDALLFTGGVGEHAPAIRAAAVDGLAHLGAALDPVRDRVADADRVVSPDGAVAAVLVVAAREDLEMARQTRGRLAATG